VAAAAQLRAASLAGSRTRYRICYTVPVAWSVTFYSDRLEAEILALPTGMVARFIRYAERIETFGPDLGMPHTRAMGDGLFELRIRAAEGIGRLLYCTVVNRRVVFLHQFVKKTDKTPLKELAVARRRLEEVRGA
jgi:phage-related protein